MGNGESKSRRGSKQSTTAEVKATSADKSPVSNAAQPTTSRGMIRSPSGADIQDRSVGFQPVDKLGKFLVKKTESQCNVSGILPEIFVKYVFPKYPELGHRLFHYFYMQSHAKTKHLGGTAFRQQCERFFNILDDVKILEIYIKMFSDTETENCSIEGLKALLRTGFTLAMVHYAEGPQTCPEIENTLDAVMNSCFFQEPLTAGFIARWLEQNCNRLISPIHRYCVHTLTTIYRDIEQHHENDGMGKGCGLELQTPVLELGSLSFGEKKRNTLLPLSVAWLLTASLPPLYSLPQSVPGNSNPPENENEDQLKPLPSQSMIAKLLSVIPSHWTLLYDSNQDGLGANRFLHHILGYKGPTLILLKCRDASKKSSVYCIAAPSEWKETHLYTGGEDSCLLQLQPKYQLMEKGAKILYLNTTIRGYPKGLRVGVDPRNPILAVNEQFDKLDVYSISNELFSMEVSFPTFSLNFPEHFLMKLPNRFGDVETNNH